MKVKYLIELLKEFNPEANVCLHGHPEHGAEKILFVLSRYNDPLNIWLEDRSDCDFEYQIKCRFNDLNGEENEIDLYYFYNDILMRNVTVDEVRECIGDDAADKMQRFCEVHGLLAKGD